MNRQKPFRPLGVIAVGLSPAILFFSSFTPQLLAQSSVNRAVAQFPEDVGSPGSSSGGGARLVEFPPTDDVGAPARTAGGATRSFSCIASTEKPLTALMPSNNVGTTIAADPSVFVYIPNTTATTGEFVIVDSSGNEIYLKQFGLPGSAGVMKLDLPAAREDGSPLLVAGETYQWQLALICDQNNRSRDAFVGGMLNRTEASADLTNSLESAETDIDRAKAYAQAKVWNEPLTILAEMRTENEQAWTDFLTSVGLNEIAAEPFVSCCTLEN